jgi:hypothetical protein
MQCILLILVTGYYGYRGADMPSHGFLFDAAHFVVGIPGQAPVSLSKLHFQYSTALVEVESRERYDLGADQTRNIVPFVMTRRNDVSAFLLNTVIAPSISPLALGGALLI